MDARKRLESNLASESEAYGYTLSIWGSGALLIHTFGVPGVDRVMAYVAGALAGFGVLTVVAFQGLSSEAMVKESPSSVVASTIHIIATGGTLEVVHLVIGFTGGQQGSVVFFAIGFLATAAYNLLLLLEELAVQLLT